MFAQPRWLLRSVLVLALLLGLSSRVSAQGEFFVGDGGSAGLIQEVQPVEVGPSRSFTTSSQPPVFSVAPLIVGLPTELNSNQGLIVQPEVQFGPPVTVQSPEMDFRWLQSQRPSADLSSPNQLVALQELIPTPSETIGLPPSVLEESYQQNAPVVMAPIFEEIVHQSPVVHRRNSWWCRWIDPCPGTGLGQERLPYSLIAIDPAQPFNNARFRTQLARRMHLPDRAEAFWQRTLDRRGPPLGESLMDYQQLNMRVELGSAKVSTAFDIPIRATNPELNANHAGLGDMSLAVKTVMLDGEQWLISQQFTTFFPTGSSTMGLGRGKIALEPGVLFRNRWNDRTWMHGQLKFWFPIAADPQHGGQVLNFATGFNRVLWETDTASLVPSLEFSYYSVLNGLARDASQTLQRIDGDDMFYITPGMHYAKDRRGDLGLFEIGSGLSFATSGDRFTDSTFMLDLRWSW